MDGEVVTINLESPASGTIPRRLEDVERQYQPVLDIAAEFNELVFIRCSSPSADSNETHTKIAASFATNRRRFPREHGLTGSGQCTSRRRFVG